VGARSAKGMSPLCASAGWRAGLELYWMVMFAAYKGHAGGPGITGQRTKGANLRAHQ